MKVNRLKGKSFGSISKSQKCIQSMKDRPWRGFDDECRERMENEYPGLVAGKVTVHSIIFTDKQIAMLTLEISQYWLMQNFGNKLLF